jgi:hypothetical protein
LPASAPQLSFAKVPPPAAKISAEKPAVSGKPAEAGVSFPATVTNGCPPPDAIPDTPVPDEISKSQIRRVAFLYLKKYEAQRDAFLKLLGEAAQTVPRKPLFLRAVLYQPLTEACEAGELRRRLSAVKAVAAIGFVHDLPEVKQRELKDTLSGRGFMYRAVSPSDAGRKSVAIDIMVDMMLLPPES